MIKLSDASVEAAGKYLHGRYYTTNRDLYWDRLSENEKIDFYDTACAAITAYLEAEKKAGRAREGEGFVKMSGKWGADEWQTTAPDYTFPALILKLEPSK